VAAAAMTGRLYERLGEALGGENVFKDVFSIKPGLDFDIVIHDWITRTTTLLALIGDRWATERLSTPDDPVRKELEQALALHVRIIPIFVRGVQMPTAKAFPDVLRPFAKLNGMPLRDDPDFDNDINRLLEALGTTTERRWRMRRRVAAAVAVLVALAGYISVRHQRRDPNTTGMVATQDAEPTQQDAEPPLADEPPPPQPLVEEGATVTTVDETASLRPTTRRSKPPPEGPRAPAHRSTTTGTIPSAAMSISTPDDKRLPSNIPGGASAAAETTRGQSVPYIAPSKLSDADYGALLSSLEKNIALLVTLEGSRAHLDLMNCHRDSYADDVARVLAVIHKIQKNLDEAIPKEALIDDLSHARKLSGAIQRREVLLSEKRQDRGPLCSKAAADEYDELRRQLPALQNESAELLRWLKSQRESATNLTVE
jgi:hypothetical protein